MQYHPSLVALLLSSAFAFIPAYQAAAADGDWLQWRGPNRADRSPETGLLKSWPESGPALVWKATGLGSGYAGVSIQGQRIYTMGDKDGASRVIALDRANGDIVWSAKVGRTGAPGWGGFEGPRATPTIDGGLVYAVGQYGEIVCLKAESGAEVWRQHMTDDLGGPRPEWGFSESLLVDGNKLVCTPGGSKGTLAALDKKTGEVIWRSTGLQDKTQYSSIIVEEHNGVRQYIQLTMKTLFGVDARSGDVLWRNDWPGRTAVIPTPIFRDGLVYAASGYGVGCNAFRLGSGGEVTALYDGSVRKVMKNHHGGVVLVGDHVYGYSDKRGWICQELETGKVVWSEEERLGKGSLTYADGHFYLRACAKGGPGTVVLIDATPEGYREKGRFDQPDRSKKHSWPHPVVAGGKLFLRDQGLLFCYEVKAR